MSNASSNNSVVNKFNSPGSREDRPILGAWTAKELAAFGYFYSEKVTKPKSGANADHRNCWELPESDWAGSSCRGMAKPVWENRQDQKVSWKSTPFEANLERAQDMSIEI